MFPELFPEDMQITKAKQTAQHINGNVKIDVELTGKERIDMAIKEYQEAMQQSDPIAHIMRTRGIGRKAATNRLRAWRLRYGKKQEGSEVENDEISIDQFLREMNADTLAIDNETEDGEAETQDETEPNTEMVSNEQDEAQKEAPKQAAENPVGIMFDQFEKAWGLLEEKRVRILQEIRDKQKELTWIEEQKDALSLVHSMFDKSTETGRSLDRKSVV